MGISYFAADYKNRLQYGYFLNLNEEELEEFCKEQEKNSFEFQVINDVMSYQEHEFKEFVLPEAAK